MRNSCPITPGSPPPGLPQGRQGLQYLRHALGLRALDPPVQVAVALPQDGDEALLMDGYFPGGEGFLGWDAPLERGSVAHRGLAMLPRRWRSYPRYFPLPLVRWQLPITGWNRPVTVGNDPDAWGNPSGILENRPDTPGDQPGTCNNCPDIRDNGPGTQ